MKKLHFIKTTAGLIFFGLVCSASYADINACGDDSYVHCAYSTDKSSGLMGNYVKFSALGQSVIFCMPYGAAGTIDNNAIIENNIPMGKQSWTFAVCADQQCNTNTLVLADNFTLSKIAEGQFKADPKNIAFSFSGHYAAVQCSMKPLDFPLKK